MMPQEHPASTRQPLVASGVLPAALVKITGDVDAEDKRAVRVLPESVNVVGVHEANEQLVVYQRPCRPE